MKHSKIEESRCEDKLARGIRTAEEVLAQAYRGASRQEMIESQLYVQESVVREMKRRQA